MTPEERLKDSQEDYERCVKLIWALGFMTLAMFCVGLIALGLALLRT